MPGVVNSRHLHDAILDSLICPETTKQRLISRGLQRPDEGYRLRIAERNAFSNRHPRVYQSCLDLLKGDLTKKGYGGNNQVYLAAYFLTKALDDRSIARTAMNEDIRSLMEMAGLILDIKSPPGMAKQVNDTVPEHFGKAQGRYAMVRTIMDAIRSGQSRAGSFRGPAQEIAKKFQIQDELNDELEKSLVLLYPNDLPSRPYTASCLHSTHMRIDIYRVSDLVVLEVEIKGLCKYFILTSVHLERLIDTLRSYSNCLMGSLISYGMNCQDQGSAAYATTKEYLEHLFRSGGRDSMLAGESAKAGSDILKARLSQTPELPFNNVKLLLSTYTPERGDAGCSYNGIIEDSGLDVDTKINLSFLWKNSIQSDSDLYEGFKDLTRALESPNKIKDDAPEQIKTSFRRSLFVGALREGRQASVVSIDGRPVPAEIERAMQAHRPSESDLRHITAGSLIGMKVIIPDVFPDVHDVSHLTFRDKSSAIEGEHIPRRLKRMEVVHQAIAKAEDDAIRKCSKLRADKFVEELSKLKGPTGYDKAIQTTANDIISSIGDNVAPLFREAERKFSAIVRSIESLDKSYGEEGFIDVLRQWAEDHPDLLINTGTEPKLGEVHKRSARVFYMFEKGMKMFLSQFERIARIADHYVKGAEIVKGESAREKHMNILSSAYTASGGGALAYEILFDLSKFSQKFNHLLIDAASEVIGELVDYPLYSHISHLFKSSMLIISGRQAFGASPGSLGAFEGFLNFLWTGVHALVMDIALKDCGRSGDLGAYSDDGLLMFMLMSSLDSPQQEISSELIDVVSSIQSTYRDFGLDFNLGKTILSRVLSEFLGQIMYQGKRMPTWMKELVKLGRREDDKAIYPMSQEVTDIASQGSALIKAGMPPYQAWLLTYYEIMLGPGRRLRGIAQQACVKVRLKNVHDRVIAAIALYFILPQSWGGSRVIDLLGSMSTADRSPLSEMVFEINRLSEFYPEVSNIWEGITDSIEPTDDYLPLLIGGASASTSGTSHGPSTIARKVAEALEMHLGEKPKHPLERSSCPQLHRSIESMNDLDLSWVGAVGGCSADSIEFEKTIAPDKSAAVRKLLTRKDRRKIQGYDRRKVQETFEWIIKLLAFGCSHKPLSSDEILRRSYPKLSISKQLPSQRKLAYVWGQPSQLYEATTITYLRNPNSKGSWRALNCEYIDELAPPLVTTDIQSAHLVSVSDIRSSCTRKLYTIAISAASQGSDISPMVDAMAQINDAPVLPLTLLSRLGDLRKIAIANRKKSMHRVYWGMAVKAQMRMWRSGQLHHELAQLPHVHYSMIITLAYAYAHLNDTLTKSSNQQKHCYVYYDQESLGSVTLSRTTVKTRLQQGYVEPPSMQKRIRPQGIPEPLYRALRFEAERSVHTAIQDISDRLMAGRMSMMADTRKLSGDLDSTEPLRSAMIWSLIGRISQSLSSLEHTAGVEAFTTVPEGFESIPSNLVNLAVVYVCYSKVQKSQASRFAVGQEEICPVPSLHILDVLSACSELGVMVTVGPAYLQSREAALKYQAILSADEMGIVYYALDTKGENSKVPYISPQRARAVSRSLEALVSQLFRDRSEKPEMDLDKLTLMTLQGCIRPSVHRSSPYNTQVAIRWIEIMIRALFIYEYEERRILENTQQTGISQHHKRRTHREEISLGEQESELLMGECLGDSIRENPPIWGSLADMGRPLGFISKLAKWGAVSPLCGHISSTMPSTSWRRPGRTHSGASERGGSTISPWLSEFCRNHQSYLYETYLKPLMAMTRTISYTALEESLRGTKFSVSNLDNSGLEAIMSDSLAMLSDKEGPDALLGCNPLYEYRDREGPFESLSPVAMSKHGSSNLCPYLLAYSLSLPVLMASGHSGYRQIVTPGRFHDSRLSDLLIDVITEYSLPKTSVGDPIDLFILIGLAEDELKQSLTESSLSTNVKAMYVIEIPPCAGAWSLGLIASMTKSRTSCVVNALSSDCQGTSLYLIAREPKLLKDRYPYHDTLLSEPSYDLSSISLSQLDLKDEALACHLISPLAMSPLLQSGLSVSYMVRANGMLYPLHAEEEFLDRRRVSFIEMAKPTQMSIDLARQPSQLGSMYIRVNKVRKSKSDPYTKLIISATYSLLISASPLDATTILSHLCLAFRVLNDDGRKELASHMADLMMTIPQIDPSSMPMNAQMAEANMVHLIPSPCPIKKSVVKHMSDLVQISGRLDRFKDTYNPLKRLFEDSGARITHNDIVSMVEAILMSDDDDEEIVMGGSYNAEQADPPTIGYHDHEVSLRHRRQFLIEPPEPPDRGKGIDLGGPSNLTVVEQTSTAERVLQQPKPKWSDIFDSDEEDEVRMEEDEETLSRWASNCLFKDIPLPAPPSDDFNFEKVTTDEQAMTIVSRLSIDLSVSDVMCQYILQSIKGFEDLVIRVETEHLETIASRCQKTKLERESEIKKGGVI